MPSDSNRRRRRIDSDDETDGSATPEHLKRPRRSTLLSPNGHDQISNGPGHLNGDSHTYSMDDFKPGSIIRVTVQNFVTYEKAEFLPGPYLNMVIGPNGTGKSSLVCAICLGLGYSPNNLGRSGSVRDFVKIGRDKATIEIELKKKPSDRHNYVVRVLISRDQNSQKWWLNGKETTHKAIQELMKSLNIQVDNLCQFLPQDRVVAFAASSPVELLHETLRAVAPEEMLIWQAQLREMYKEKKNLLDSSQTDADTLANLETRQQGLQADVDRLRERDEINKRVATLKLVKKLAKYHEARNEYIAVKADRRKVETLVISLERENKPSLQAVEQKKSYLGKVTSALEARSKALDHAYNRSDGFREKIKCVQESIDTFEEKMAIEGRIFDARKKEVATARSKITSLQADLKNRPGEFDAVEWNQKIRAEEHRIREIEQTERELNTQQRSLYEKVQSPAQRISKLKDSLESLNTQEGQQLSMMQKRFPDTALAWNWIKEHMKEFKEEVFAPPMISCSIKDEKYSSHVQSLLQMDDFTCFTTQNREDFKKLSDQLYRAMSLSVVIRSCSQPLDNFKPPVSQKEAVMLGLDGFAIDFLEGPAPVLAMLCSEKRLHQSGVALQDHDNEQYNRLASSGSISQWAAGKHLFMLRRRKEYGAKAMTTISKSINEGRFWSSQPIDLQEKAEWTRQLNEARAEQAELRKERDAIAEKMKALSEERDTITAKIDEIRKEKNTLQREYQKWQSLPDKIEAEERRMTEAQQTMNEVRSGIYASQDEKDQLITAKFQAVMDHATSIQDLRAAHEALLEAKIYAIEASSDVVGLKVRNKHIVNQLETLKKQLKEAVEAVRAAQDSARKLKKETEKVLEENSDRLTELEAMARGKTEHDIDLEIDAERAQLELIQASSPTALADFEERGQEIARLQRKKEAVDRKVAALTASQASLMRKWEPRLDGLVEQINGAFARNFEHISCAGEVRVLKPEDFESWALQIMVRFRDSESLQQLTAHRQSGGERAVSTVFFLMALQSLAQSPFRVVDEINQGMDPRNERLVHDRMVDIACREHASQYLLVTPKLLPGLRYDPKMRVLCIASGEFMPRDGGKLDFNRCLAILRSTAAAAA